jgi:hypothetical protein
VRHRWLTDKASMDASGSDLKIQHCEACGACREQIIKETSWVGRDGDSVRSRRRIVWGYATGDARRFVFKKKAPQCVGRRVLK